MLQKIYRGTVHLLFFGFVLFLAWYGTMFFYGKKMEKSALEALKEAISTGQEKSRLYVVESGTWQEMSKAFSPQYAVVDTESYGVNTWWFLVRFPDGAHYGFEMDRKADIWRIRAERSAEPKAEKE
jgi:hypothetical protein